MAGADLPVPGLARDDFRLREGCWWLGDQVEDVEKSLTLSHYSPSKIPFSPVLNNSRESPS